MQVQIFTVPMLANQQQIDEVNTFLRSHSIIDMEKNCVTNNSTTFWTFCIRYTEGTHIEKTLVKSKVDYKEVLDEPTFKIFSDLRECRKKIADNMGIPVYTVFTNEELAVVARLPQITGDNLKKIQGIGDKRMEKYGIELLRLYDALI